eukprot:354995-Chlamydomonas_euryale.AAC.4
MRHPPPCNPHSEHFNRVTNVDPRCPPWSPSSSILGKLHVLWSHGLTHLCHGFDYLSLYPHALLHAQQEAAEKALPPVIEEEGIDVLMIQ